MSLVAIVVPFKPGTQRRALELLAQGPPFDPEGAGLEGHHVLVTEAEAIFVLETAEPHVVDRLVGEIRVWVGAVGWEQLIAGVPRFGETTYSWRLHEPDASLSSAPTPGPGDSDGGDVFAP